MAGKIALMYRREEARNRLTGAIDALVERLGVGIEPIPVTGRDADLLAVTQLEAMASALEAIDAELAARDAQSKADAATTTSAPKAKASAAKKDGS